MSNLYGLFGEKLGHSFSPIIHKLILEQLKIEGSYHLFELNKQDINIAISGLKVLKAKGVNVTIPYKKEVMKYLDEISTESKKIGAVNTIVFKDNKATGYNTDYFGIGNTLKKNNIDIEGKDVVVLGTGGAAITAVSYLIDNKVKEVTVVTRDKRRVDVEDIKDRVTLITYEELRAYGKCSLLINCTPKGMYPNIDDCPLEDEVIEKFDAVFDLIFNPTETVLLKKARENGAKVMNGLYMLVSQAVKAEEIWNDVKIDHKDIDYIHDVIKNSIK
jgi:shikimate dehydrogenase